MNRYLVSKRIERDFCLMFKRLSQDSAYHPDFSGIGLVLYDPYVFDCGVCVDLRPSVPCPRDVRLGEGKAVSIFLEMSDKSHELHDGFHFLSCITGLMTHAAQYFFPPVRPGIEINENYGTRYRSAQYGSCIAGVVLTGVINSDNRYHIFRKGCLIQEDELIR